MVMMFIKHTANEKIFADAHRFATKNNLSKNSIAVRYAYASSKVLDGLPFIAPVIADAINRIPATPVAKNNRMTGMDIISKVLLSQVNVDLFSVYGLLQLITHSLPDRYSCCPPSVSEHERHVVGKTVVHVKQTGLQAGQVFVASSKNPPEEQLDKHLYVAQSRILSVKKSQHSNHEVEDNSHSLHLVEHFLQELEAVST